MKNRGNDRTKQAVDYTVVAAIRSANCLRLRNKKCPDQLDPGILSMFKNELLQFKRYR